MSSPTPKIHSAIIKANGGWYHVGMFHEPRYTNWKEVHLYDAHGNELAELRFDRNTNITLQNIKDKCPSNLDSSEIKEAKDYSHWYTLWKFPINIKNK